MKKIIFIALALLTNSFSLSATRDIQIKNWFDFLNHDITKKTNYEEIRLTYEHFFLHLVEAINKKYLEVANLGLNMNVTFLRHFQQIVGNDLPMIFVPNMENKPISSQEIDFMDVFNQHCIVIFSAKDFSTANIFYKQFLNYKNSPVVSSFSYALELSKIIDVMLQEHCNSLFLAEQQIVTQPGSLLTQISQEITSSNQCRENQIKNWFSLLDTTFYEQLDYQKANFLYGQFFCHILESLEKGYLDAANIGIEMTISFFKHLHDIAIDEDAKRAYSVEIKLMQRFNDICSQNFSIDHIHTIEKIKTELNSFITESKGLGFEYAYQLGINLQSLFDKCLKILIPEITTPSSSSENNNRDHIDPTILKLLGDTLDARRNKIEDDESLETNDILPTCTTSTATRPIIIRPIVKNSYKTIKKLICDVILYNEYLTRYKGTPLEFSDSLFKFHMDNFSFCLDDFKITIPKFGVWRCAFKDASYQLTDTDILVILDLVRQCYDSTIESDAVVVKHRAKKWAAVNATYNVKTTSAHASSGTNIASKHTKSVGLNGGAAGDAVSIVNETKTKFHNTFRILSEQYYREKEQEAKEEEEAIQRAIREEEEERLQEQKRIAEEEKRARWIKLASDARRDVAAMDDYIAKGKMGVPPKPRNLLNDIKTGAATLKETPKAPRKHSTIIIPNMTNEESDSDSDEWTD